MFDRLDANHDGNISRQEFMAGGQQVRQERVFIMRDGSGPSEPGMKMHMRGMGMHGFGGHLFDMADANHDGRVSLAEAQAAALAHFDKADVNHDGRITPEERQQAHQLRRERRQS
jgi:Ca2+-binding EF-hand superfamily protein